MECFNLIYAHLSVQYLDIRTHLVNIPEPVQYDIYILAFPFDLRCESGNYIYIHTHIYIYNACKYVQN